jgi:hypothetical protein
MGNVTKALKKRNGKVTWVGFGTFNPPAADKGLIPRPLGRLKITDGYPVACSGVVHKSLPKNTQRPESSDRGTN